MTDKIADAIRRMRGYWFIDGLAEIGASILFVVLSIPYLRWSLAPEGSSMAKFASGGRDILLLLGIVIFYGRGSDKGNYCELWYGQYGFIFSRHGGGCIDLRWTGLSQFTAPHATANGETR